MQINDIASGTPQITIAGTGFRHDPVVQDSGHGGTVSPDLHLDDLEWGLRVGRFRH